MKNLRIKLLQPDPMCPWSMRLVAFAREEGGKLFTAQEVKFTEVVDPSGIGFPIQQGDGTMLLLDKHGHNDAIQGLMDSMWQSGIRPSDVGTAGHLAATQKHLEDMRALTSHMLKVELPK